MTITDKHKKLLEYLSEEGCYFYPSLEGLTGIPTKELKQLLLEMKIAGYVIWTQVVNADWMFCGSGHLLTDEGIRLKNELKIENKYGAEDQYCD
jgi:hypothetical protein